MGNNVASYFVGVKGSLIMSLIAFSIVFIVITGLMFMMMGMKHVSNAIDGIKKHDKKEKLPTSKKSSALMVVSTTKSKAVDGELIAVITAAITAMCGKSFRILSFAPIKAPQASAWRVMNRINNIENF
ncbi:MAG: OadG family protein [Synergistaceae bacterium]|nr:OadG family protein [Synergistaceae bacterium]